MKTRFTCPTNPNRKFIDSMAMDFAKRRNLTIEYLRGWKLTIESQQSFHRLDDLYSQVDEACNMATRVTHWDKLLYEYCGGLSEPSKMPCFSWSIPAHFCDTGAKLHLVENSTCESCYALRGRYIFDNVKLAMARRLVTFNQSGNMFHSTFVLVLSRFLNWNLENQVANVDSRYFRWLDSGDVQSVGMLASMVDIARNCPGVKFWLPTREHGLLWGLSDIPTNLIIRYSTPMVDTLSRRENSTMVASKLAMVPSNCSACPATFNDDHTCNGNACRSCWSSGHIAYLKH